jgi:hypothetical protein
MQEREQVPKLMYDRKSAAYALSISIRSLDYALATGAFETRRKGRKVLITAGSLKRYAATNHYGPVAGPKKEAALKGDAAANHSGPVGGSEQGAE